MPSEPEVKRGWDAGDGTQTFTCSVTNKPCGCGPRSKCLGKPIVDPVPKATVRELRSTRLLLEAGIERLDTIQEDYLRVRAFPGPEVRDLRRKLVTCISMIDEIGGEL